MSTPVLAEGHNQLVATIDDYLAQISLSLRASSVKCARGVLGRFARFLAEAHPEVVGAADIGRPHIESYKAWLARRPGLKGKPAINTIRHNLSTVRMFLERIIEWGWDDAPLRVPIFAGDIPKKDEPLPKFLDDPTFALFMRAARAQERPLTRLAVELLARTGMRVGELCSLEADAVVLIGETHWLRIPVGKLHNDRYIPLHPHLVDMLAEWHQTPGAHAGGRLLTNNGQPLNHQAVRRMLNRITKAAGIGHVHPHQLRHTVATQAINRGMSIEAIAALLGHRSLDMTMTYARIADRTVADEYFSVTEKVEALYSQAPRLPADAEGPAMARLRREHHRMLGNGYCTRPVELDCAFETICEGCTYFATSIEFRPTLRRQHRDATKKNQTGRAELSATCSTGWTRRDQPVQLPVDSDYPHNAGDAPAAGSGSRSGSRQGGQPSLLNVSGGSVVAVRPARLSWSTRRCSGLSVPTSSTLVPAESRGPRWGVGCSA